MPKIYLLWLIKHQDYLIFMPSPVFMLLIVNYVFISLWGINGAVLASFSGVILFILLVYYYGFQIDSNETKEVVPWKNIGQLF